MAIINKTGITNGGTIESEHITRIIHLTDPLHQHHLQLLHHLR